MRLIRPAIETERGLCFRAECSDDVRCEVQPDADVTVAQMTY